jgi:hypothetical protein
MMTSVLAGAYPDIFAAGVVDSGVAYGCFALPGQAQDSWNSQCAEGQLIKTGAQWVRSFDKYYTLGLMNAPNLGCASPHRVSQLYWHLSQDARYVALVALPHDMISE